MAKKRARSKAATELTTVPLDRLEIDFVILADAAQVKDGKLYMLGGGWSVYHAKQYPLNFPFSIAIGILVPWSETNLTHKFEFVIKASEGETLGKGNGEFEIGRAVGIRPGVTQRVTLAVGGQLGAQAPGTFEVIVTIRGDEKRITFELLKAPPKSAS